MSLQGIPANLKEIGGQFWWEPLHQLDLFWNQLGEGSNVSLNMESCFEQSGNRGQTN